VYKGTSGFTIDPQDCPEDWDPHQGITDTEVRFMMSLPRSGPLAGFGAIGDGVKSYFDYVNSQGGIDGRQLMLDIKDDGYQPDRTKSNVDEAIESESYAAFASILGTPNVGAIRDTTEDECMPNLFVATGGPQWGDPEHYKFTIGGAGNYWTEAALWAEWLQTEHPELTSIATVTFNNDFGHVYLEALPAAIEDTPLKIVGSEVHEATAPNLDNQLTSLTATNADVLIITAGIPRKPDETRLDLLKKNVDNLRDNVLPIADGRALRDTFVRNNKCTPQNPPEPAYGSLTHIVTAYSGCLSGYPVVWAAFDGAGHDPGPIDGSTGDGWHTWTSGVVWNFFTQFAGGPPPTSTPSTTPTTTPTTTPGGGQGALHAVGAGKCLDDPNSSTTTGTQQQIYDCNGQPNQSWTHSSSGALSVTVNGTTLCLDANNKGTTNGTKAILYSCNGQTNQQWTVNSNGTITGVQSGLCLDVTGASTANGALVELWTCNGGSNQQWTVG